ncbi:hypothetical protein REPUB_Repub15cG0100600 [Reevesia pubescens]
MLEKVANGILSGLVKVSGFFTGPILFVKKFSYKEVNRAIDGFHWIVYSNARGVAYKAKFEGGEVALVKEARAFNEGK